VVDALGNPIFFLTDGQTSFDLWEPRSYCHKSKLRRFSRDQSLRC
jgi:hypothetical protein